MVGRTRTTSRRDRGVPSPVAHRARCVLAPWGHCRAHDRQRCSGPCQEVSVLSPAARRSRHSLPAIAATAFLSAMLIFAVAAVSIPREVLGANSTKVALCSANLRSTASTKARVLKLIGTGTKVIANAKVTGGSWRTTCAGKAVSGNTWYRIYSVNGRTIKSMFGVTYVYGASGLFKA